MSTCLIRVFGLFTLLRTFQRSKVGRITRVFCSCIENIIKLFSYESRGHQGLSPFSVDFFIFIQTFSANIMWNNRLVVPFWKQNTRLIPPGNPGSATAMLQVELDLMNPAANRSIQEEAAQSICHSMKQNTRLPSEYKVLFKEDDNNHG